MHILWEGGEMKLKVSWKNQSMERWGDEFSDIEEYDIVEAVKKMVAHVGINNLDKTPIEIRIFHYDEEVKVGGTD
jgi:hypothetical protein